jgi:hypothetical protein
MVIFYDSKYSQPWPDISYLAGDRKSPDTTGLSMAKQYSSLNLDRIQGVYTGQGEDTYAASVSNQLL